MPGNGRPVRGLLSLRLVERRRATRAVGAPCLAARCGPPASPPAQALFGFISLVCMPLCMSRVNAKAQAQKKKD